MPAQEQLAHMGFKVITTFLGIIAVRNLDLIERNQDAIYRKLAEIHDYQKRTGPKY